MRNPLRRALVSHPGRLRPGQSLAVYVGRTHHALVWMKRCVKVFATDTDHEIRPLNAFDVVAPPRAGASLQFYASIARDDKALEAQTRRLSLSSDPFVDGIECIAQALSL